MRIGVDIDGVMYHWDKTARYMLREVLPDSPYKDALNEPGLYWNHIQDQVSKEHWSWLWSEGVRLGLFRHGHLFKGTIVAMRQLAELGDVIAITHRPKAAVNDTMAWLSYQQLPVSGVHILTNQEAKSGVQHCDAYIDDKPENCEDYLLNTKAPIVAMPARPWNRAIGPELLKHEHIHRLRIVFDWNSFVEECRKL